MNIKKWIIGVIAALSISGLSGCSSNKIDEDAYAAYTTAYEKSQEMQSAKFNIKLLIDSKGTESGDVKGKIDFNGLFKVADGHPELSGGANFSINGVKISDMMNFYFFEDVMYMDIMGSKYKQPLDQEEAETENKQALNEFGDLKEYLEACSMESVDGKTLIHMTFKKDFLGNIMDMMKDSLDTKYKEEDIERVKKAFDAIQIDFTVDENGYFSSYGGELEMDIDDQVIKLELSMELEDINQIGDITYPDFSEYVEQENFEDDLEDFATGGGKMPSGSNYDEIGGDNL